MSFVCSKMRTRGSITAGVILIGLLSSLVIITDSVRSQSESLLAQAAGGVLDWQGRPTNSGSVGTNKNEKKVVPLRHECEKGYDYVAYINDQNQSVVTGITSCLGRDRTLKCPHVRFVNTKEDSPSPDQEYNEWKCDVWYCTGENCNQLKKALCQLTPQQIMGSQEAGGSCTTPIQALTTQKDIIVARETGDLGARTQLMDDGKFSSIENAFKECSQDYANSVGCEKEREALEQAVKERSAAEKHVAEKETLEKITSPQQPARPVPTAGIDGNRAGLAGISNKACGLFGCGSQQSAPPSSSWNQPSTFSNGYDSLACSISADPKIITRTDSQQPVTIRWELTSESPENPAYRAVITSIGTVPPQGSRIVYPTGTTQYSMTGFGYVRNSVDCDVTVTVQQESAYGTGTDGKACTKPPEQPLTTLCSGGVWKPVSGSGNGCITGWQCIPSSGAPVAHLRCEPGSVDVGMSVGLMWSCFNASKSQGYGFETDSKPSGVTTKTILSTSTQQVVTLSCASPVATTTAHCTIAVDTPAVLFVAEPKEVGVGQQSTLSWVGSANVQACTLTAGDDENNTISLGREGIVTTAKIATSTAYALRCVTINGSVVGTTTTVRVH